MRKWDCLKCSFQNAKFHLLQKVFDTILALSWYRFP